jgi:ethanolamine ammonia-lyase small subunit
MSKELNNIQSSVSTDTWINLKAFTPARIALGRTGVSIPLQEILQFKLAHAHAKDAVYASLQTNALMYQLQDFQVPIIPINSKANNRQQYLQRPDLGKQLDESFVALIQSITTHHISIVVADGLSATAVNKHAYLLLQILIPSLKKHQYTIAPIVIATQARVALGDAIAWQQKSNLVIVLIGERPGLSVSDSLGVYITYNPKPGFTEEKRNCISNIHAAGLNYATAAEKILYLVKACFKLQLSGVALKENQSLIL